MDNIDAGACDEFRAMLLDLSDRIRECDLEMMKFYCKPSVAKVRLENVTKAINLWEALEERGLISANNTSFLLELFEKAIKRNDLSKMVIDYDQRSRNRNTQSTDVSAVNNGSKLYYFSCYYTNEGYKSTACIIPYSF